MFDALNKTYKDLYDRAMALCTPLKNQGYSLKWGYYAFHSVKVKNEYVTEYFPIPVINVNGICDVGFDLDCVFVEAMLYREEAIEFNFSTIPYNFEAYGATEYLQDFYNNNMDLEGINKRIEESKEQEIGIGFEFEKNVDDVHVLNLINYLNENGCHINSNN